MKKKVLVVEDDENLLESITNALELKFTFEVESASNGLEALDCLRENQDPIPLILTDYHMPEMDGLELTKIVREEYPDIAIVIMTASVDPNFNDEVMENKIAEFLPKPFNIKTLCTAIEKVFE